MSSPLYAKNLAGDLLPLRSTELWEVRQELAKQYCPGEPERIRLLVEEREKEEKQEEEKEKAGEEKVSVIPFLITDRRPIHLFMSHGFHPWTQYVGGMARRYYRIEVEILEAMEKGCHRYSFACLYEPMMNQFIAETVDIYEECQDDDVHEVYLLVDETTPHYDSFYALLEADKRLPLRIRNALIRAVYRKWRRTLCSLLQCIMEQDGIPVRPQTFPMIHHRRLLWEPYHQFIRTPPPYASGR
jgi:hypothetical protein